MHLEVEQKFRVDDIAAVVAMLAARGVTIGPPVAQVDQYFAHPQRDFARTDEALRIRSSRGKSFVTYKGAKLDTATKTRPELELPLADTDADGSQFSELLQALGFRPVAVVHKSRRSFAIEFRGRSVEGALDEVEGVGSFVELELQASRENLDEARTAIGTLAAELKLGNVERRSYLELLLQRAC